MTFRRPIRYLAAPVALALFLATSLLAQEKYLAAGHPNGSVLLAPAPLPNSAEQAADMASARAVFNGRTPKEEARANKLAVLTIFNFASAIGPFFKEEKFPKTAAFFVKLKPEIKPAIDATKNSWKRKRPYELDPALALGKPEASTGYPSGHSTIGTIHALLLAELFPDKRDAILAIGREIGWSRVIIGKHFPTDVHAGRVLGQAIVRELLASPAFQRDFAEIKAEVQAVRQSVP
jgi:acid phosphatase (class A)